MKLGLAGTGLAAALGLAGLAQDGAPSVDAAAIRAEFSEGELRRLATHTGLGAPPPDATNRAALDPTAALLGQRLFFDPRVSADGSRSCASCHEPDKGFADGRALSATLDGEGELARHTPSLWNVAFGRWFFWDGRADTLWSQALKPTESEIELGGDRAAVAHLIHGDEALRADYEAAFGPLPPLDDATRFPPPARPVPNDPDHAHDVAWRAMSAEDRAEIDRVFANYGKALAAYQQRLVSSRSAFDVFADGLAGGDPEQLAALEPAARRGLRIFLGRGNCRMCHAGPNFTDGEFHGTGVAPLGGGNLVDPARYDGVRLLGEDPFNSLSSHSDDPAGERGERAAQVRTLRRGPETWGEFKTPTLRNVALSPPYMHQGQFASLAEVVRFYSTLEGAAPPGHHQEQVLQPLGLDEGEQADLVAFLEALTDTGVDPALLAPPAR